MKISLTIVGICCAFFAQSQAIPSGYKLVYQQDFSTGAKAMREFQFTQPDKWLIAREEKSNAVLEFTGKSDYEPPFRSPHTIGLITNLSVGSFILEADLLQTGKEYGHRDMCIFFGFQDAAHFYYSHIASKMDDHAHQVMLVNAAPRTRISTFTTEGVEWGDRQWHHIRIERDIQTGSIKVFFNRVLIQEATDKTFGAGFIGFGSFDDSGMIDNIRIWSDRAERKQAPAFSPSIK
jgi:hypothetical protein